MNVRGVVEVSRDLPPELMRTLVRRAYRSSRRRAVLLLVDEAQRKAVDAVLDEVVETMGMGYAGVQYGHPAEFADEALHAATEGAEFVIAGSQVLRERLTRSGVFHVGAEEGSVLLEILSRARRDSRGSRGLAEVSGAGRDQPRPPGARAGGRAADPSGRTSRR